MVLSSLVLTSSFLLPDMVSSMWPLHLVCKVQWSCWEVNTDDEELNGEMPWIRWWCLSSPMRFKGHAPGKEDMITYAEMIGRRAKNATTCTYKWWSAETTTVQPETVSSKLEWNVVIRRSITMIAEQRSEPKFSLVTLFVYPVQKAGSRLSSLIHVRRKHFVHTLYIVKAGNGRLYRRNNRMLIWIFQSVRGRKLKWLIRVSQRGNPLPLLNHQLTAKWPREPGQDAR